MIKRFSSLLRKEFNLGLKNFFLPISLALIVIGVLLYQFVVPEEIESDINVYVNFQGEITDVMKDSLDELLDEVDEEFIVDSRDDVFELVEENRGSMGVIIGLEGNEPSIEFVLQGNEPEEFVNIMEMAITAGLYQVILGEPGYETVEIGEADKIILSYKDKVVPVYLLLEPAVMGLFTIACLMFFEKEQETTKGLLVTPGKLGESLAAKVAFQVVFSSVLGLIFILLTVGLQGNTLQAVTIVVTSGFFFTAIGMLLASLVESMNQVFGFIIVGALILMTPVLFFMMPGGMPVFATYIPTTWALNGLVEAFFGNGEWEVILKTAGTYIVGGTVIFILGKENLKRKLAKG